MTTIAIDRGVPRWALPLHQPARYKGAKGGRGSGKSHEFAAMAVEAMVADPDLRFVCIREVQRSLKFSAKSLIEAKIRELGVSELFEVLTTEIRRKGGHGVMIFEGMQDHTADSLKSLEGFKRAWVEEAQSLSQRSIDLLLPTIRAEGSEIWFSWNPSQPDDPVDKLLVEALPENAVVVHANYTDNPWCPEPIREEAERLRALDLDAYDHIWLGGYDVKSEARVLAGKYRVAEFEPLPTWDGPYHGADFGFAQDPTTLVRVWVADRRLYVEYEAYRVGLELDHTAAHWQDHVPGFHEYVVRADSARPESISYLQRHGVPKIKGVEKWSGSVKDGIAHLRSYDEIVIHPRCEHTIEEARLYSYRVDRRTGDVLPEIEDKHNHIMDAIRYALTPLIKPAPTMFIGRA